jgi:exopolyphosphatase/pppGpp-phosphohydrolase
MSELVAGILSLAGIIISLFLLNYILRTSKKMKSLNAQEKQLTEQIDKVHEDTRLNATQSIKIIAQCMLDEQMELSEGCIRIKVLLDHVAPEFHEDPYFKIFSQVYDATQHMPTHEARKAADKKLIMKLDLERLNLEDEHKEAILSASRQLLSRLT